MVDSICDRAFCIGCGACKSRCPQRAISMQKDEEGFLYPFIDKALCIDCHICKNICPINVGPNDNSSPSFSYAVQSIDEEVRLQSSSGGVFSLLAEYIIDQGGTVYGVGFDAEFNVVHEGCGAKGKIGMLRGSKYVQSDMQNVYLEIEQHLIRNEKVLFTGTPCQIGAIKAFLKNDYPNLYTQDIICHGVPSPLVWRRYVEYCEREAGSTVESISFRNKQSGWKTYSMRFRFSNGTEYIQKLTDDSYMRIFLSNICLRQSCYSCPFKTNHRQADITLADFWGLNEVVPEYDDDKGTSLVLINSEKGRVLFNAILPHVRFKETGFTESIKKNPSFFSSAIKPPLRKAFFADLERKDFEKLCDKYCGSRLSSRIRRIIARMASLLGERNGR